MQRKVIHTDHLMLVQVEFDEGIQTAPDPMHSHPHEQITYVEDGEIFFFLGTEKFLLKKGQMITIPSNIPHCIQRLADMVRLVDCFSPIREDYL